ncbi:transcriptional regulator [Desulfatitalea alkaliphila]|uniref:Transcriptional regulator n=1 Tax=Desulfatitalea alkaliphila TaxID=2929485 RepID=A0AA41UQB0_9BACT|nr:transcriptional regulator [Desulfatitalea alkaliphila]MCJ8501208.1 transcriptional regulator [Desulfatitalea alkaliphila]
MLEQGPVDPSRLATALGLREKELLTHLPHIAKTVTARKDRLIVTPAECSACGFVFKERRRLAPPGRCPKCKQSRILGPWYEVHPAGRTVP